jgi:hypothetical protein
MHPVYLVNYDCTTHPILPFIPIATKFLSKHCIKRVLDTEMNGYHCFNFTEKLSYEVYTLSNQKMSNFYFDLSLQKFSGEVQNDLRGGAHLPTPPLKIRPRYKHLSVKVNLDKKFRSEFKTQIHLFCFVRSVFCKNLLAKRVHMFARSCSSHVVPLQSDDSYLRA